MSDVSEPLIPPDTWDAAALPPGFTASDGVALMAIESGLALAPWQFDWLAAVYAAHESGEPIRFRPRM